MVWVWSDELATLVGIAADRVPLMAFRVPVDEDLEAFARRVLGVTEGDGERSAA